MLKDVDDSLAWYWDEFWYTYIYFYICLYVFIYIIYIYIFVFFASTSNTSLWFHTVFGDFFLLKVGGNRNWFPILISKKWVVGKSQPRKNQPWEPWDLKSLVVTGDPKEPGEKNRSKPLCFGGPELILKEVEMIQNSTGYRILQTSHLSNEKRAPGWLGYIGDEILPRYIGIIS